MSTKIQEKNQEVNKMECTLCNLEMVDKVYTTCSAKHAFCFSCILKNIEITNEIKPCPLCRGGEKYIMIENVPNTIQRDSDNFYSLDYFRKSIPILQKILSDNNVSPNSCLLSEQLLVTYVKNRKQLEIAHKLLVQDNYKIPDIIPLIKWYEKRGFDEIGAEIFTNIANEIFNPRQVHLGGQQVPPTEQNPRHFFNSPNISFGTFPFQFPSRR